MGIILFRDMGALPTSIAWLYRAVKERKARTGARFSVRVSALEITSQREEIRDLLAPYESETDAQSPGVYLRQLPTPAGLQRQSELRASSAEKAAHYLDAALAGRSLDAQVRMSTLAKIRILVKFTRMLVEFNLILVEFS